MDTIIHLAATPDDDDFMMSLLPNIVGANPEVSALFDGTGRLIEREFNYARLARPEGQRDRRAAFERYPLGCNRAVGLVVAVVVGWNWDISILPNRRHQSSAPALLDVPQAGRRPEDP